MGVKIALDCPFKRTISQDIYGLTKKFKHFLLLLESFYTSFTSFSNSANF